MVDCLAPVRRKGVRSLLAVALASVSSFALNLPAYAQSAETAARTADAARDYDIPAQPLASALLRFAEQSDLQVLFSQDDLRGLVSPDLRGRYTPEQALSVLMSRSGREARITPAGAVAIEAAARPQTGGGRADELVVTGTRIRGAAPVGAQLVVIDRAEIEATGRSTVQDVLTTLPQNFPGAQGESTQINGLDARRNIAFGSSVDLRGLGADATLALVEGRRLAPAGFGNFVDISSIPLSAVERIEVLPDGASATYGADAVGGVVNVRLRSAFDGAETSLRYGGADAMSELGVSHLLGARWRGGDLIAAYEYRRRDALHARDRDFAADSDLTSLGGSNFSFLGGAPGNITRVGAATVAYPIPAGQNGLSLRQSQLVTGPLHVQNTNEGAYLLPEQTSHAVFASLRQRLGERLDLFANFIGSERSAYAERAQIAANLTVPATNAYRQRNNLFPGAGNLIVGYWFGNDLGPIINDTDSDARMISLGARYDFGAGWQGEAVLSVARHQDHAATLNQFNSTGPIREALASSDLATAFNPFGDGGDSNAAVIASLTRGSVYDTNSEIAAFSLKADGPLLSFAGRTLRAAFGAERREERFSIDRAIIDVFGIAPDHVQRPGSRGIDAIFAEVYAPLISPDDNVPLAHDLIVSLSARRESPSDFEAATTPRLGVRWSPVAALALHAAWGRSFKAPQFQQMLGGIGGTLTTATATQDPFATNGSTGILILLGSNPTLEPERADIWTAGFGYHPSWLEGLHLEGAYFDIDFTNRIGTPAAVTAALRDPRGLESVFFRNPSRAMIDAYLAIPDTINGAMPADGVEVIFDSRLTNLASLRVRGVDLGASYRRTAGPGTIMAQASVSGLLQFERTAQAGAAGIDVLNTLFNPIDWRGRASVTWLQSNWSAAAALNYVDDYRETQAANARRIKSWTSVDLRLSYDFRAESAGPGTRLTFNVQNVFDRDPPFANNSAGYGFDSANFSPVGRFASIELRRTW